MINQNNGITWIKSGSLVGNPTYNYGYGDSGCETLCGTRQNWKLGITPKIPNINKTRIKTELYSKSFIIELNPQTTQGGVCRGQWKLASEPNKHKILIELIIYDKSNKILSTNTHTASGGSPIVIPISAYGRYRFNIKTKEWGENCKKPTNTYSINIQIIEPSNSENSDGGTGDEGDEESTNGLDTIYIKYVIATGIGAGVIIAISSLMSSR